MPRAGLERFVARRGRTHVTPYCADNAFSRIHSHLATKHSSVTYVVRTAHCQPSSAPGGMTNPLGRRPERRRGAGACRERRARASRPRGPGGRAADDGPRAADAGESAGCRRKKGGGAAAGRSRRVAAPRRLCLARPRDPRRFLQRDMRDGGGRNGGGGKRAEERVSARGPTDGEPRLPRGIAAAVTTTTTTNTATATPPTRPVAAATTTTNRPGTATGHRDGVVPARQSPLPAVAAPGPSMAPCRGDRRSLAAGTCRSTRPVTPGAPRARRDLPLPRAPRLRAPRRRAPLARGPTARGPGATTRVPVDAPAAVDASEAGSFAPLQAADRCRLSRPLGKDVVSVVSGGPGGVRAANGFDGRWDDGELPATPTRGGELGPRSRAEAKSPVAGRDTAPRSQAGAFGRFHLGTAWGAGGFMSGSHGIRRPRQRRVSRFFRPCFEAPSGGNAARASHGPSFVRGWPTPFLSSPPPSFPAQCFVGPMRSSTLSELDAGL